MKIHEDHNGMYVRPIIHSFDGDYVEGSRYEWVASKRSGTIQFHTGPVKQTGLNGLTTEALLAVLIHRTGFLDSKFPCKENKMAMEFMQRALECFDSRTKDRIYRNVEGKNLT